MARPIRTTRRDRPALLAILAELYGSIEERDIGNVERLCELEARRLPREVREEAMAVVRTPVGGFRAPLRLLLFWRAARVLDAQQRIEARAREQLELDLRTPRPSGGASARRGRRDAHLLRMRRARRDGQGQPPQGLPHLLPPSSPQSSTQDDDAGDR